MSVEQHTIMIQVGSDLTSTQQAKFKQLLEDALDRIDDHVMSILEEECDAVNLNVDNVWVESVSLLN